MTERRIKPGNVVILKLGRTPQRMTVMRLRAEWSQIQGNSVLVQLAPERGSREYIELVRLAKHATYEDGSPIHPTAYGE